MKNDDELIRTVETLMEIYGGEDKVLTGSDAQWRGAAVFSGPVQVDAAAEVEEDDVLRSDGSAQACRCIMERGGRREGKEGKMKGGLLDPIYKEKGNTVTGGREKQGGQRMIIQPLGRLDFRNGY